MPYSIKCQRVSVNLDDRTAHVETDLAAMCDAIRKNDRSDDAIRLLMTDRMQVELLRDVAASATLSPLTHQIIRILAARVEGEQP